MIGDINMKNTIKKPLGIHILLELYECNKEILNNLDFVEDKMVKSAVLAGADVREFVFHKFNPQGVTGVVVIAESHITIHTWPELEYAAIDVFTCGSKVKPQKAVNFLIRKFSADDVKIKEIKRG